MTQSPKHDHADSRFVILKYVHKTPSLATCERCNIKFFTPSELMGRSLQAEDHLREKFASHTCKPSVTAPKQ
jgi:hypothetical protein